jgi:hypothetical protein
MPTGEVSFRKLDHSVVLKWIGISEGLHRGDFDFVDANIAG